MPLQPEQFLPIAQAHRLMIPCAQALAEPLYREYLQARDRPDTHRSHYFEGRFENIYIDRQALPALSPLLALATEAAALLCPASPPLQVGYWFNEMAPGQRTLMHTHDEAEECLSAVYYVRVPPESGRFLLGSGRGQRKIEPMTGSLLFFPPTLLHGVETNRSTQTRLSLAMNFGPRHA